MTSGWSDADRTYCLKVAEKVLQLLARESAEVQWSNSEVFYLGE